MDDKNITALVEAVVQGTANESDYGIVLKTMKNQLSVNLIRSLNTTFVSINNLNDTVNDAIAKFNDRYSESSDILDMETLMGYISDIQDKQYRLMDLLRKTIQGKELFASDVLSEEEKKVIKLFKSFKTTEEKKKFLALVDESLKSL